MFKQLRSHPDCWIRVDNNIVKVLAKLVRFIRLPVPLMQNNFVCSIADLLCPRFHGTSNLLVNRSAWRSQSVVQNKFFWCTVDDMGQQYLFAYATQSITFSTSGRFVLRHVSVFLTDYIHFVPFLLGTRIFANSGSNPNSF